MNKQFAVGMLICLAAAAWSDPLATPATPSPSTPLPSASATPRLALPPKGKTDQSNVMELEPIKGNLNRKLPKYGPGWRRDPVVNLPGLPGMGTQNGSATGPR